MSFARVAAIAFLVVAGFGASPSASALGCNPGAVPIPIGDFGYFVSDGGPAQGYAASGWIYIESNGVAGLQRGGSSPVTNEPDPCQSDYSDTNFGGTSTPLGQPVPTVAYPGFVEVFDFGAGPMLSNPLGWDCGAITGSGTSASVTCNAPLVVPPPFVAGCANLLMYGIQGSLGPGEITSTMSCGAVSVQCSSGVGTANAACMAEAPAPPAGTLPMSCAADLAPGATYYGWATVCMWH